MPNDPEACPFCEIVAGRGPAQVIDEDELSMCLLDINPLGEGHCLVISKRHVPWWHDLSEEEVVSVFRITKRVANRLRTTFAPDFVCMYARGRRVPHTHIFLVPTSKDDVLDAVFAALERVQESSRQLAGLGEPARLRETAQAIRRGAASRAGDTPP